MDSRPTPSGFQHAIELPLRCAPDARFTDPIRALVDLESGLTQPVVEIIKERREGGVVVRVSVFSGDSQPTHDEVAAVHGLVAELTYMDNRRALKSGSVKTSRI